MKRIQLCAMSTVFEQTSRPLQLKMFGEFSISNEHFSLATTKKNGLSNFLLIAYLVSNRGNHITTESLIEMLWPTEKASNPSGALRTLIYRVRKDLAKFFPDEEIELIERTNNIYSWNFDVPCSIDVYEFESYYHQASREQDPQQQYELLTKAFNLYTGEFLPMFSYHSWVMFRNNYYGNLYVHCANKMCQYLNQSGDYEGIITLCEKAFEYAPAIDETLYKQKIYAMLKLDRAQAALDYYHSILDMFSREHGLDISDSMHDIYEQIISCLPNQYQTISALETQLRQRNCSPGSFYCNFDIFQNIYQINLRSVRRSQRHRFLILLTLRDSTTPAAVSDELKEEMDLLQQIMESRLRTNDVYTKSSFCQYSLIITASGEAGCDVVKTRLLSTYNSRTRHKHITLTIDSNEIL